MTGIVNVKVTVFLAVTPCSLVDTYSGNLYSDYAYIKFFGKLFSSL